ncbi:MAG: hypothetical protein IJR54_02870 [Oscillibacter sp.]|nr:hypothetical protein [Oscillibacter sp.]
MSIEMITALSSIVVSLLTLVYTIISNDKQSVLQSVTANRMDWIQQVRSLLGDFAHAYRTHNTENMADIEARLELFMRRDVKEYQYVLNHLKHCIKHEYNENDYEKLLSLSSYTLSRAWQRIKVDARKYHITDKTADQIVTKQVQPLLDIVKSYDTKQKKQA